MTDTTNTWWHQVRPRLIILYLCVALTLLTLSGAGHLRLLREVGSTFGGFFWAIANGEVVLVSTLPQLRPLEFKAESLSSNAHIIATNQQQGITGLVSAYQHVRPGHLITYTVLQNDHLSSFTRPAAQFTVDMWWQNYGLALLAGISWLIVGGFLLATATEWPRAVEGLALLPVAMLLLLYSHWGNVQQPYQPDIVIQFLWTPSFALLGAAFIHLSLTYRPEALNTSQRPRLLVDGLPYLPIFALFTYECVSYIISGLVPTNINFLLSLGYGTIGGLVSFGIGINSLLHVWRLLPYRRSANAAVANPISARVHQRIGDSLIVWIGGVGLGFCTSILPILLNGEPLVSFPVFYLLAAIYPFILCYAIRILRLLDRLQVTLEQREEALIQQQKTAEELLSANRELKQATSLLLHADAHLRSLLSQRIHDQPKQQALRIRSLLNYWQRKLRVEAEREEKVAVKPIIEIMGKVRTISEELEDDLRGLQRLVEDVYQRRSLGLQLHLEKSIWEDLPALHPESSLKVQADLRALDAFNPDLETTEEGVKIAEAISYTVTQALLNIYNHADATLATIHTQYIDGMLEVSISDDGHGFDPNAVSPEKTSLFKAHLKAREAGGTITLQSVPRPQTGHGAAVILHIPVSPVKHQATSGP
jgi:hypothetical protein